MSFSFARSSEAREVRDHGIEAVIARHRVEHGSGLGKYRCSHHGPRARESATGRAEPLTIHQSTASSALAETTSLQNNINNSQQFTQSPISIETIH
jgi:hypothetical protein